MAKFIALPLYGQDGSVWLNPDHVISIEQIGDQQVQVRISVETNNAHLLSINGQAQWVAAELDGSVR